MCIRTWPYLLRCSATVRYPLGPLCSPRAAWSSGRLRVPMLSRHPNPCPPPPYRRPTRLPALALPLRASTAAAPPFIGSLSALCHLVIVALYVNRPAAVAALVAWGDCSGVSAVQAPPFFLTRAGQSPARVSCNVGQFPCCGSCARRLGAAVASYSEWSPVPRACGRASPNLLHRCRGFCHSCPR